jgi:phage terminase large subunit-like protein
LSGLEALYGGTRLARQELEGVLVPGDGALWRRGEIEGARGARPQKFDRVVVGVDPPAGTEGSACGIVAAGRLGKQGFVLEDASVAGLSPMGWAMRVVETAEKHGATRIIAEANQGGDMVRATLAAAGVKCRIELVHARHAKRARAEPIAALYEQGKVTHCGAFPQLEEEMMALGGAEETAGQARLDRADALVWALTALLVEKQPLRPGIILL